MNVAGVSPVWAVDSNIGYRCGTPHVASFAPCRFHVACCNGLMLPAVWCLLHAVGCTVARCNGLTPQCCLLHVFAHFESLTSMRAFESFDWKVVFENFDPAWRSTARMGAVWMGECAWERAACVCLRACMCVCVCACV